jgi:hypothetical protein
MARLWIVLGRILMASAAAVAISMAAPTSATAALDVTGAWTSVDQEGTEQMMTVERIPDTKQFSVHATSAKAAPCGGMAADASGIGTMSADGRQLMVEFQVSCMVQMRAVCSFTAEVPYDYNPETGTLTDQFRVAWSRPAEPIER